MKVPTPGEGIVACLNREKEWRYFSLWNKTNQPSIALKEGYTDFNFIPWHVGSSFSPRDIVTDDHIRKLHVTHTLHISTMKWLPIHTDSHPYEEADKWLALLNSTQS